MNRLLKKILAFLIFAAIHPGRALADIRLPRLVSDGMVLQRNANTRIWGWADQGEKVTIKFLGKTYTTTTGPDGKWAILLSPLKEGGPYAMQIQGKNDIELNNILIGDVWVCSGQSNMVTPMERVKEVYPGEIESSANDHIRQFLLAVKYEFNGPAENVFSGKWESANPKTVLQFSATAYFFARKIYERYRVPIGIINTAVGGPPVEAWISEPALAPFPRLQAAIQPFKNKSYIDSINAASAAFSKKWSDELDQKDPGLIATTRWYEEDIDTRSWRKVSIPGYWADQGFPDHKGSFWFRKEINVPASEAGKPAKLYMGRIIDADYLYVNGTQVGHISYQYPPRRYEVPAGVLKAGHNTIAIRVINNGGRGGFAFGKKYYLKLPTDSIELSGEWLMETGARMPPPQNVSVNVLYQPSGLFNAMIAPLTNYTIKGALWYQGEGNIGRAQGYHELFSTMIADWRKHWRQGNFPFLFVQLPNYGDIATEPGFSSWSHVREEQFKTLSVPNTAMAVTIDVGEWYDLHPVYKKPMGERLALAAQALAYGDKKIVYSGPLYKSMKVQGSQIILDFTHKGSGLVLHDATPTGFEVAGADGKFIWANARVENSRVVVWHDAVKNPVAARYAWSDSPPSVTLYNKEGLPASPFRTDTFSLSRNLVTPWNGRSSAVVLTYDDALNVHLDKVIPLLDSVKLRGTFYLTAYSGALRDRIGEWRTAAIHGHELGNHTLFHPCAGNLPGRGFVTEYDLSKYSVQRMVDEVRMTNSVLSAIDGRSKRTFAYPCGDMKIGDSVYLTSMRHEFTGARGVRNYFPEMGEVDLFDIGAYSVNGQSGQQLIEEVKKAMNRRGLLVFLFHGVGGEHSINVSLEAHRELIRFLKEHEREIWIAPMTRVAEFMAEKRGQ